MVQSQKEMQNQKKQERRKKVVVVMKKKQCVCEWYKIATSG